MRNITTKLTCRAELWGMIPFENELKEQDVIEGKIKDLIYCNILPRDNMNKQNSGITKSIEHSHKFKVRKKSIANISMNMFFVFNGLRYNFKSWNPDFQNGEFIEIFTDLILE